MASKKKEIETPIEQQEIIEKSQETQEQQEIIEEKSEKQQKTTKKEVKTPKYAIGSIVYIEKDADADLNGFKLFPQYKKYAYTVEAYNQDTGVYTLRRLNLSLSIKEDLIVAPDERAHDQLNRMQF